MTNLYISRFLPLILVLCTPLMLTTQSDKLYAVAVGQAFLMGLRMCDIAMQPVATVASWSLLDFYEYILTFGTKESRSVKTNSSIDNSVPVKSRGWSYYRRVSVVLLLQYCIYNVSLYYLQYVAEKKPETRAFTTMDYKCILDQVMAALCVYSAYSIAYSIFFHSCAEAFQIPYKPCMDNPFIALGLQEFWSSRWNHPVKESLKNAAFIPIMLLLKKQTPGGDSPKFRPPSWHMAIASLSAFLLSALMHEWLVIALCDSPTRFEQFSFFMLHGFLSMTEVLFRKYIKRSFGMDPFKAVPSLLINIMTWAIMVYTANLFTAPFLRDSTLFKASFPLMFV